MAIKEPKEERQLVFFRALFESGDPEVAREAAEYTKETVRRLVSTYKDYIAEHTNGHMTLSMLQAAKELTDTVNWDGRDMSKDVKRIRLDAAKDVLDRAGVIKQTGLKVDAESDMASIFILPQKDIKDIEDDKN